MAEEILDQMRDVVDGQIVCNRLILRVHSSSYLTNLAPTLGLRGTEACRASCYHSTRRFRGTNDPTPSTNIYIQ